MLPWRMNFEPVSSPLPLGDSSAACQPPRPRPIRPSRVGKLQLNALPELLRSVDYGGLMGQLTPFRINTSKKSRHFCIAFIINDFKSTRINTSVIFRVNPSRINTSKKTGGWGVHAHSFRFCPERRFGNRPTSITARDSLPLIRRSHRPAAECSFAGIQYHVGFGPHRDARADAVSLKPRRACASVNTILREVE